jgi:hypothetical protein
MPIAGINAIIVEPLGINGSASRLAYKTYGPKGCYIYSKK